MKRLRTAIRSLVVVGAAVATTLILFEFAIRTVAPQPLHYYDFEVRDGGKALVAGNVREARYVLPPGQGPYRPGHEYWMGRYRVRINSKGWRDVEHELEKPAGTFRIGIIGDSVTFGTGVQLEDIYFRVLEQLLRRRGYGHVEVLGFAGGASNAYFAKLVIEDAVSAYDLDAVVLGFNLNDILPAQRVQAEANAATKVKSKRTLLSELAEMADGVFRSDSHLFHVFRERAKAVFRRAGFVDPNMTFQAFLEMEDDRAIRAWGDTSDILTDIDAFLKTRDIPFIVAVVPVDMQVSSDIAEMYRKQGFRFSHSLEEGLPQKRVQELAERHDFLIADPLDRFRRTPNVVKFIRTEGGSIDWAHLRPEGHVLLAEAILDVLMENDILSRSH